MPNPALVYDLKKDSIEMADLASLTNNCYRESASLNLLNIPMELVKDIVKVLITNRCCLEMDRRLNV